MKTIEQRLSSLQAKLDRERAAQARKQALAADRQQQDDIRELRRLERLRRERDARAEAVPLLTRWNMLHVLGTPQQEYVVPMLKARERDAKKEKSRAKFRQQFPGKEPWW